MARPRLTVALCLPVVAGLLSLALSVTACKGSSSSSTSSSAGRPSAAEIRWTDGGPAELVLADRVMPLPSAELAQAMHPPVMQDEQGTRLAYVSASGDARIVYVVGPRMYLGPTVKAPVDFGAAPDLDHALGALFANAADRRALLVADVLEKKGEPGVVRLLVDGAGVDAREWDDAFAKLPEARAAEVKSSLATLLDRGKPTTGLRRAVVLVPLREPSRAPALAARLRELSEPVREPRASAVMLRALAVSDKAQAAQVGCDVLAKKPLDTVNAKGTPEEIDLPGREALVEASLVAIAAGGTECPHVAAYLGEDVCTPSFRCNDSGPLTGRETTKQDEPLCTKEQLARAVAKELERTPADALAAPNGTRPQLFAFANLSAAGKIPASLTTAHLRRRYALVQPKEPECESGVAPGTACHCEEAIVRDQTCRHGEGNNVHVGVCKFDIDDKQKKLLNVVATPPP